MSQAPEGTWTMSQMHLPDLLTPCGKCFHVLMNHMDVPSQWEIALQCKGISHWLGAYTEWSLHCHHYTPGYPPHNEVVWGWVYWFHSVCPSICPFVCPSARRWQHKYVGAACGASSFTWYLYQICNTDVHPSIPSSHVHSVAPTVLVGSFSHLYILSSNFRRCTMSCKIAKFEFSGIFQNL